MTTTAEAFKVAFSHHQAGKLREAEAIYRRILEREPDHVDAMHLLGLVAYQVGRYDMAIQLIGRAATLADHRAVLHGNLGEAYRSAGQLVSAQRHLRRALQLDPGLPDAHNSLGNVLRAEGRLEEATVAFRQAIKLKPTFPEAHNNLATVLHAQGDVDGAIAQYQHALRLKPDYAEAHYNLGAACREQEKLEEAIQCFRQALAIDPAHEDARIGLGSVYQTVRQFDKAETCFRAVLQLKPDSAQGYLSLGALNKEIGRHDDARESFLRAIQLDPQSAEAHFHLASLHHVQKDWPAAAREYQAALDVNPHFAKALANLGSVLQHQGDLDGALARYSRAIELDPGYAQAHLNRANVYRALRRNDEAMAGYERALELQPHFPEAYNNLAAFYNDLSRPDDAIACCRKGIEQEPKSAAIYANLATALQNLGRVDEAVEASRTSVALRPEGVGEYSNLIYKLNFNPRFTPADIFAEHLQWAARHAEPLRAEWRPHTNDRNFHRRLRVGYVSPYFREHAVNFFSEPLIVAHDRQQVEVVCYSDSRLADSATERIKGRADHWREVRYKTDEELVQLVRQDQIDILVDLTGHIAGNRLLAFARKPAPVQVTYIGYQNTTGMSAMDYRLTDAWADPPGVTDPFYTEKLVRLPRSYFCYRPSDDAPDVSPLPASERGFITFGSFNNSAKLAPVVFDTWVELLACVPTARLMILAHQGGYLRQHLDERMRAAGLDPGRIELCEKRPRGEYLELLRQADIALDPFPFNGHTTTCDSIWMGLPVVMLAGQSYASRFGGSVLRNVGLEGLVTTSTRQYLETASALAADSERLSDLRATLRSRLIASALMDTAGFARHVEDAYRQMWIRWCQDLPPVAIG
jgi:predicted O-linked N-acetylglucosamine transferase (SPINDLY family)